MRWALGCCASTPTRSASTPGFTILDRGDAADLLDLVRQELGLARTDRRFPQEGHLPRDLLLRGQRDRHPLDRVLRDGFPWCAEWAAELKRLFAAYVAAKQRQGVLDYDDLLLWWERMAAGPGRRGRRWGRRFDYRPGRRVPGHQRHPGRDPAAASSRTGAGVTVVGDDAQAIYAFRAATVRNILDFPRPFAPPATVVTLEQNYRSTQPILAAANAVIGQARERYRKELFSSRPLGAAAGVWSLVRDDLAQAAATSPAGAGEPRGGPARCAIRRCCSGPRSHSAALELELARRNIPYVKYRRPALLRGGARQGCAGRPALGREPARPGRRVPRPAAAARHRPGHRAPDAGLALAGRLPALGELRPPAAAAEHLAAAARSCSPSCRRPRLAGAARAGARASTIRCSSELYDFAACAAADLDQLERLAATVAYARALPDRADPGSARGERRRRPGRRTRTRTT